MTTTSKTPQAIPAYPQFYRNKGRCLKVISPTETRTIVLPPDSLVPERFTTNYPSAERLTEALQGFTQVEEITYKDFQVTFYKELSAEIQTINKHRYFTSNEPMI